MKKSLYLTETKHYLVYKTLIFLLFYPSYHQHIGFLRKCFYICFLSLSFSGLKGKMHTDGIATYYLRNFFGKKLKLLQC